MSSSPKTVSLEQRAARRRNVVIARDEFLRKSADRAVDDPATLARAARIVRAALARQVLTPEDLQGPIVKASGLSDSAAT